MKTRVPGKLAKTATLADKPENEKRDQTLRHCSNFMLTMAKSVKTRMASDPICKVTLGTLNVTNYGIFNP